MSEVLVRTVRTHTFNETVKLQSVERAVRTELVEVQSRVRSNCKRLVASGKSSCFVSTVSLCPSTGSGRTVLPSYFGIATNQLVNAQHFAKNSVKTVRAEPVEACSRRLRGAKPVSASLGLIRLCPSTGSGRTVLFTDFGTDTTSGIPHV